MERERITNLFLIPNVLRGIPNNGTVASYGRRFLAGYKVPKRSATVDPAVLPVNPSGKIVERKLRGEDL